MMGGCPVLEKKSLKDLQKDSKIIGIAIERVTTHRLKASDVDKGKGMIQVLWERGFIDVARMKDYKGMAKDKVTKKDIPELSLLHMMKLVTNFG